MLEYEISDFFYEKMPFIELGREAHNYPIAPKGIRADSRKEISFQTQERGVHTEKRLAFLKSILEQGSDFYLINYLDVTAYFGDEYQKDTLAIFGTYDWLGEIEEGFDLYLYKFSSTALQLETFLEGKKDLAFMLIDIQNKIYINCYFKSLFLVANTKLELKNYLKLRR